MKVVIKHGIIGWIAAVEEDRYKSESNELTRGPPEFVQYFRL